MPIPHQFYYNETQGTAECISPYTGSLDINQLIQGKPCWIPLTQSRENKPKKLVLADWTAWSWTPEKISAVQQKLNELMVQGFSIYMWRDGTVSLMDPYHVSQLEDQRIREAMTLTPESEIVRATVAQHKLPPEQIKVIDNYWLDHLMSDTETLGPRILRTNQLQPEHIIPLNAMLNSLSPPLSQIIHDQFSVKTQDIVKQLHHTEIPLETHIKIAALGIDEARYLSSCTEEETLAIITQLCDVETIILPNEFKTTADQTFFTQHLKKLANWFNLKDSIKKTLVFEQLSWPEGWEQPIWEYVEEIYVQSTNILRFILTVKNPLTKLKKLKFLNKNDLQNFEALAERLSLKNSNTFAQLEEVWFNHVDLMNLILQMAPGLKKIHVTGHSVVNLQTLLTSAYQFNTIDLSDNEQLGNLTLSLEPGSLANLAHINLSRSPILAENLDAILKAAPNLKKINLRYCEINDTLTLNPGSLASIEEMIVHEILFDNLCILLNATTNVRKLDGYEWDNLLSNEKLDLSKLNNLEDIRITTISSSPIEFKYLKSILQPTLKKIDISSEAQLPGTVDLTPGSLVGIEQITFTNKLISRNKKTQEPIISIQNLQIILNAAPNIKTLNLNNCHYKQLEPLILLPGSLVNLEEIDFNNTLFSSTDLLTIFLAAPNLKRVKLSGDISTLQLTAEQMTCLQKIDLQACTVSPSLLQTVLNAPQLTKIKLGQLKKGGNTVLTLESSRLEQLVEFYAESPHIFSQDNWQTIQNRAFNLDTASRANIQYNQKYFTENIQYNKKYSTDRLFSTKKTEGNARDAEKMTPPKGINHTTQPPEQPHNSKQMKEFSPKHSKDSIFSKGFNQGRIVNQLSKYLQLTQKHLCIIPKINNGICLALSLYFVEKSEAYWNNFIHKVNTWDGCVLKDEELILYFEELLRFIQNHQLQQEKQLRHYLGDNLKELLKTRQPYILINPWHAIAIKPEHDNTNNWSVYDPNYVDGYRSVNQEVLLTTLHTAIGEIISVNISTELQGLITNPEGFIEHGGLLILCRANNTEQILKQLPIQHNWSKQSLDGLLLRNVSGIPAWLTGIGSHNTSICRFTWGLLQAFDTQYPDAASQLSRSMDALSAEEKGNAINTLVKSSNEFGAQLLVSALCEKIRLSTQKTDYERTFRTWDTTAKEETSALSYSKDCLVTPYNKRLIELESTQHVNTLRLQLQQLAVNTSKPVFYIDKPDDLICNAPWMKKNSDNTGELCQSPGGPLYEFLQANQDGQPLLIVNYERFHTDDIIKFNRLLDKTPDADGIQLPKDTKIIGLLNRNKPDCYQGSDFYSRFDHKERCPLSKSQLDALASTRCIHVSTTLDGNPTIINLYHSPDWEGRLLGRWVLNDNVLTFAEGELDNAIKTGQPIEIQNGLWGDPTFERFWQHALSGGYRHAGRIVQIPEHIKIIRPEHEAYDWESLKHALVQPSESPANTQHIKILNPTSLSYFFDRSTLNGTTLIKESGWLSSAPLTVLLTRTLSDDAWAMLLAECNRLETQLTLHCVPGVKLPAAFGEPQITQPSINENNDYVIYSTDFDTTVSMLMKKNPNHITINVSGYTASDLLMRLNTKLNTTGQLHFEFSQSEGVLAKLLATNCNIILKGHCSPDLLDALAQIWFDRAQTRVDNQLILVTDDETAGAFASTHSQHVVGPEHKLYCLPFDDAIKDKLAAVLTKEPLSKLMSRGYYLQTHPDSAIGEEAWTGIYHLRGNTQVSTETVDTHTSLADSALFIQERITAVDQALASRPYVMLTGHSGVGKSTFIEKEYCKDKTLYSTMDKLHTWINDQTGDQQKILFIDEANLINGLSVFEGLNNAPPTLLIHDTLYELPNTHKIVFALNPASYAGERKLPDFLKHNGNAVLFKPLSPAVIYEQILKPIFYGTAINHELIAGRILAVYRFICERATTEILISPRELQMMALLTIIRAEQQPEQDINLIAEHFSYTLAHDLLPASQRGAFDQQFKPQTTLGPVSKQQDPEEKFLITPSRQQLSQQLDDLLNLRKWRRNQNSTLNDAQKAGGLGGIIIEGMPGIGKSELVKQVLRSHGYKQQHDFEHPTREKNTFYDIPVSMPPQEKEKLLLKAFNEGAVVIIDEINSSPTMESWLNSLLMGKNPLHPETPPENLGFMLIGTQNPITMGGRRATSTALQRRLINTGVDEYKPDEIKQILMPMLKDIVTEDEIDSLVEIYECARTHAVKHNLSPAPTFRDLMHLANSMSKKMSGATADGELVIVEDEESSLRPRYR
jgi:MoxR-like ATPase